MEHMDEKRQLSVLVKKMRAYAGLSQRQLSSKIGVSQADISKIERGLANPSLSTISRIAEGTGTRVTLDFYVDEINATIERTSLLKEKIEKCSQEAAMLAKIAMADDLDKVILYGSCARGDYTEDSDVDIALFTKCDRLEAKKYTEKLADAATILMTHYNQIVNYVCVPSTEFYEKREWYPYFKNIDTEGMVLYG